MSKSQASAAAAVVAAAGVAAAAASAGDAVQAINDKNPPADSAVVDEAELQRLAAESAAAERAAVAVATAEAAAATHVPARVLAECEFGKPNDLASVPVERVDELVKTFVIDTHPEAVRYAERLAAGEISG